MILIDYEGLRQLTFLDATPELHPYEAGIRIGDTSSCAIERICIAYPDITHFSYIVFDPNFTSSDSGLESKSDIVWLPRDSINASSLRTLAKKVENDTEGVIEYGPNKFFKLTGAIALTSLLKMKDGTEMHLPMLDFECPITEKNQELITNILRKPGVLINSGRSYHFIGTNPIQPDIWQKNMKSYSFLNQHRRGKGFVFDENHIQLSLDKGFSALRIFGYANTGKPNEPRVVGFIDRN